MLKLSDRVKESSLTTGSGVITFSGAFRGFQTFSRGIGDGNTTYYTIENGSNYEVGIGTYSSGTNTLSRDLVLDSSNNNQLINLVDTSIVFCTYPADYSAFLNTDGYISGQSPFYSGIAFPDGTIQTTSLDGNGSENKIAYWSDENTLDSIENISWNSNTDQLLVSGDVYISNSLSVNNDLFVYDDCFLVGDVNISGILQASGSVLTKPQLNEALFYRTSAGCFFHAYVDNAYDNMVALYSSNEPNPYWRLGIKPYTTNFTTAPTVGYAEGENGQVGMYATPSNYAVITYVNGFWITQDNVNVFNVDIEEGVRIFNQDAAVVPITVRSAPAQAVNIQEWETYSSNVVASISNSGQISINSVKFPDGTVQSTAYIAESEKYISISSSLSLPPEYDLVFVNCSISNVTITLPNAVNFGGKKITIKRKAGGEKTLTIIPSGSQLLDSSSSFLMPYDNQSITVVSDNSNWFIV